MHHTPALVINKIQTCLVAIYNCHSTLMQCIEHTTSHLLSRHLNQLLKQAVHIPPQELLFPLMINLTTNLFYNNLLQLIKERFEPDVQLQAT